MRTPISCWKPFPAHAFWRPNRTPAHQRLLPPPAPLDVCLVPLGVPSKTARLVRWEPLRRGGARRTGGGWVWRCIRESSFTCSRAARSRARPGRAHGGICRWFSGTLQVKRSVVLWVESGWVFRPTAGLCVFGVSHLLRRRQCGHEAQRSPGGGWTHDVLGLARVILAEREMKESHLNS